MSNRKDLNDIINQKMMLVAKADLQRSNFILCTNLATTYLRIAETAIIAINTGKAIARYIKK